jgi:hypothetical protein
MNDERENKEWLNGYQTLKQVNPANPFLVPANYFEEMEGRIMGNIRLLNLEQGHTGDGFVMTENYFNELTQNIQSRIAIDEVLNTEKGFIVPENYFDELSQNIQSRIAIDEVLNTEQGFTVPENYFDELSQNIQGRIAIDEVLNTEKGFAVPESYFEELSQNIQSRIAIDEVLNTEKGFTVPENYFAGLENRILQKTINTPAKQIKKEQGIVRKLWTTAAFKYATAACFSLFVGAAIFVSEFNDTTIHSRADLHKALAKIPASDIEAYLQLNADAPTILEDADPNSLSTLPSDNSGQDKIN